MKKGDLVRFNPGQQYVSDWLDNKFQIEPGAIGIVDGPCKNIVGLAHTIGARQGDSRYVARVHWIAVLFPPLVGPWMIPEEDLEVVE